MVQNILFIVNPISVNRKMVEIEKLIQKNIHPGQYNYKIVYSQYHSHAVELVEKYFDKYDIFIAAGGDGTLNQVSQVLAGTDKTLGIIPLGSGNGLARALKIPLKPEKAIKRIVNNNVIFIDSGTIAGLHFINIAGVGFDAEIAHDFSSSAIRGVKTYIKKTLFRFFGYSPANYTLEYNGNKEKVSPFILSVANSGQYGNNAYISPLAEFNDGLLDICIVQMFPKWKVVFMAWRMFFKTLHKSEYVRIIRTNTLKISSENKIKGHVDGEPVLFNNELEINILRNSIRVIV